MPPSECFYVFNGCAYPQLCEDGCYRLPKMKCKVVRYTFAGELEDGPFNSVPAAQMWLDKTFDSDQLKWHNQDSSDECYVYVPPGHRERGAPIDFFRKTVSILGTPNKAYAEPLCWRAEIRIER